MVVSQSLLSRIGFLALSTGFSENWNKACPVFEVSGVGGLWGHFHSGLPALSFLMLIQTVEITETQLDILKTYYINNS